MEAKLLNERSDREKERVTKLKFKEWLDSHHVPYWYIHQHVDTYSNAVKRFMRKWIAVFLPKGYSSGRLSNSGPDFILLIPRVGLILTHVEYKNPLEKHEDFPIDYEETKQYINSQKYFNLEVWYVLSGEKHSFNTWLWISATKILQKGKKYLSLEDKTEYLSVPIGEFIQVAKSDNLETLSEICKY